MNERRELITPSGKGLTGLRKGIYKFFEKPLFRITDGLSKRVPPGRDPADTDILPDHLITGLPLEDDVQEW